MTVTDCECDGPKEGERTFFCERHKCRKTKHFHTLCKTRPDYFQLWEEGCGPWQEGARSNSRKRQPKPIELGDVVQAALTTAGITEERVTSWIGRPCGCSQRREKLNALSRWAKELVSGKTAEAKMALEKMLGN